jgi:hypothetical protein
MSKLTSLEDQVLRMLLAGDDEALSVLRKQAKQASVSSRKMTGVGFYTTFEIPPEAPRLTGRASFKFGDVNGRAANLKHGLGFLLYVADGALNALEGYTYDEPWPKEVQGLVLSYSEGQNRNLHDLNMILHQK